LTSSSYAENPDTNSPEAENAQSQQRVPAPNPPPAKASFSQTQECVEPIDVIRRFHGDFLKHQRDDTMYQGIRTRKHSLVKCIDCHVHSETNINTSEHFCNSCHSYAAVTIDCFQCHASQPGAVPGLEPVTATEASADSVDSN
ncbi:MAG: hypothetical protein SVR94_08085, partial [Pseudomonadota bacterium]|nr:hypothetical protein [Pseudomonadota bacterium]